MIDSISDLIRALRDQEQSIIEKENIKHPVILGEQFENLTKRLVTESFLTSPIFRNLDLHVTDGFIINADGSDSKQLDCLLTVGSGKDIAYSSGRKRYRLSDVIAVIEVKKTLYGTELTDAYDNLISTINKKVFDPDSFGILDLAFRSITGSPLPETNEELAHLSEQSQATYYCLRNDACLPIRIVFGYGGYTTEAGLRKGFINNLQRRFTPGTRSLGIDPASIPNLILCGDVAICKLNGMPIAAYSAQAPHSWLLVGSTDLHAIRVFLDIILSRIVSKFQLHCDIFGEDLSLEPLNILLQSEFIHFGDQRGWRYTAENLPKKSTSNSSALIAWQPTELSADEFHLIIRLCAEEYITATDARLFCEYVSSQGRDPADIFRKLIQCRLIYPTSDGTYRLLTKQLQPAILPDGRFVAGENNTGKFTRWLERHIELKTYSKQ